MILMPCVERYAAIALDGNGVENNGLALHGDSFVNRYFAMQNDKV